MRKLTMKQMREQRDKHHLEHGSSPTGEPILQPVPPTSDAGTYRGSRLSDGVEYPVTVSYRGSK